MAIVSGSVLIILFYGSIWLYLCCPDIAKNDGWQIPDINFNTLFKRGERVPDPNNPGGTYNDTTVICTALRKL
ncbi:MAG: hypothetical protein R2765_07970 [Ferruginibacter sp.]